MGLSYLRSKFPMLIKFASHHHNTPFSNIHGGFSLLSQHCVSSVSPFKRMHTHQRISNGIRYYHGNKTTALASRSMADIVLSSKLGTGIPLRSWIRKPGFIKFAGLAFLGIVLFVRLERIPYTNRYHLVFSSKTLEKYLGAFSLWTFREKNLIPADDIRSVRVHNVLEDIVGAMSSDLRLKKEGSVVSLDKWMLDNNKKDEKMAETTSFRQIKTYSRERREKEFRFGPFGTKHLEGLEWEVRVMDDDEINAFYTTRGKIVVHSGLLDKLKSDEELAIVLAHEVGHGVAAVAQHINDHLMKVVLTLLIFMLLLVLIQAQSGGSQSTSYPTYQKREYPDFLKPFFCWLSRRKEMEADHIGLMLMASAGYDPRTAPKVFEEKLGGRDCSGLYDTHPTGKKRADKLREPKVMEKAVEIYKKAKLCHSSVVEGS